MNLLAEPFLNGAWWYFEAQLERSEDLENLKKAILKYKNEIAADQIAPKFIKHFSTFMTSWRDYLDDDHGSIDLPAKPKRDYSFLKDKQWHATNSFKA